MSIKKRLIMSNIAMVTLPLVLFLMIEVALGYVMFAVAGVSTTDTAALEMFVAIRLALVLAAITLTNGLLAFFVSRSILRPVRQLMHAARQIGEGNLDAPIQSTGNDELGKLAETFENMRARLKEAEALQHRYERNRKQLIARISHDLKTPLTAIRGYVRGILDGVADTPDKMNRYVRTIDRKANDLEALIDELFLYSKLELQSEPLHVRPVDLKPYFADLVDELRYELEPQGGSVDYRYRDDESYVVYADGEKLQRVVTNIIRNSLDNMDKAAPRIRVQLQEEPDRVTVRIADNGRGIPEEAVPYIFDSFYRADPSRNRSGGGSGLGLAIAKSIVELHGGVIGADSRLGEGTCIHFTLKKLTERR